MVYSSNPSQRRPGVLQSGVGPSSAKLTPTERSGRQLEVYDPTTKQISMIDTCFGTHHLMFARDANDTLWTSSGGGGGVVGWLNTKMWDKTHDAGEIARLDGTGFGHQRQRQAGRLCGGRAKRGRRGHRGKSGRRRRREYEDRSHEGHAPERRVLWPRHRAGRSSLGFGAGLPGRNRPPEPRIQSAGNCPRGILRGALERPEGSRVGLLAARHGRRRRRSGLGGAGQRPHGQLRPSQVQRPVEWAERQPADSARRVGRSTRRRDQSSRSLDLSGSADSHYYIWSIRYDTLGLGKNTPSSPAIPRIP